MEVELSEKGKRFYRSLIRKHNRGLLSSSETEDINVLTYFPLNGEDPDQDSYDELMTDIEVSKEDYPEDHAQGQKLKLSFRRLFEEGYIEKVK